MLIKRTILFLVILLNSMNTILGQTDKKKKAMVKLGTTGLTFREVSKGDSVMYYAVYLANVVKFMDEDYYNFSRLQFSTKEDVLKWFDEAINASYSLQENPDKIIYGEGVVYSRRSGNTLISANYKPDDYFKCTSMLLEKARKIFIKKTM